MSRFLLLIILLSVYGHLLAAPNIDLKTSYYSVTGNSRQSVRDDILKLGPVGKNGLRFHAQTQWNIDWSFRWIKSGQQCKLQQHDVNLKVHILLPEFKQSRLLGDTYHSQWLDYITALEKHENQHRDFAIAAAREIYNMISSLYQWHACSRLESMINHKAQDILDDYTAREIAFDLRTDHGAKDGVVLP